MDEGLDERRWTRLVAEIEDGQVVPIVGPELSLLPDDSGRTLTEVVADTLANNLEVSRARLTALPSVTEVAVEYVRGNRDPSDLYYEVRRIIKSRNWPIPEPLRLLASISGFDLFVSTCFDDSLSRAIDEARFNRAPRTVNLAYSPVKQPIDLPNTIDCPIVYQIFGAVSTSPEYALGEEDLLRFTHQLQSRDRRPERLFEQLRTKSLLILGNSFPDWLMRFFLALAKGEQLFAEPGSRGVIADRRTRLDSSLVRFLDRRKASVYTAGDGVAFVAELHKRWRDSPKATVSSVAPPADLPPFEPGSVFISYAGEDRAAALRLRDALSRADIDAWLDTRELRAGDDFKAVIFRNIERSAFFLPVISRNTMTVDRRFFRLEWNKAREEAGFRAEAFPFIQPVVIDDTLADPTHFLPSEFLSRHWQRCPDGVPPLEFIALTRDRVRALRRAQQRGSTT